MVNPQRRELDGEIRKDVGKLNRKRNEFGALMLSDTIEPNQIEAYQQKKAELQEAIIIL